MPNKIKLNIKITKTKSNRALLHIYGFRVWIIKSCELFGFIKKPHIKQAIKWDFKDSKAILRKSDNPTMFLVIATDRRLPKERFHNELKDEPKLEKLHKRSALNPWGVNPIWVHRTILLRGAYEGRELTDAIRLWWACAQGWWKCWLMIMRVIYHYQTIYLYSVFDFFIAFSAIFYVDYLWWLI